MRVEGQVEGSRKAEGWKPEANHQLPVTTGREVRYDPDAMKALWANDIHLEFLAPRQYDEFLQRLAEAECDCLLLGGDIGTAPNILGYLSDIQRTVRKPVYFVLGNHDYYRGSIFVIRASMQELHASPRWLGGMEFVPLTHKTCLVGHDGWGDGRYGNYAQSGVTLNDFRLIRELKGLAREAQLARMMALGDEAAEHFGRVLPKALAAAEHVVVLTHVSPFVESCIHEGRPSDADWLPFFSCKAAGDVLRDAMRQRPDRQMTVLCGHTHGHGTCQILPNLEVHTGGAKYGEPTIQRVFEWM